MDWKLELIVVPVSDVDRAKQFYSEQVGFVVDVDSSPSPEFRVVQLTPPGSACSISIGTGLTHVERGVDVSPIRHVGEAGWADGKGGDYNSFLFFSDPDGNRWAVQESPLLRT